MAILLKEYVKQGMRPEWYMGFSWYDPITNTVVAYPIPFNLVMRFFHWLYFKVAYPSRTKLEKHMSEILAQKFREGRDMGIVVGRNQIYDEIKAELKKQHEYRDIAKDNEK